MAQEYDTYQVCENGHGINDRYITNTKFNKNFCTECGKKTITECPSCGENIKGGSIIRNRVLAGIKGNTTVPNICEHCGEDFPWKP